MKKVLLTTVMLLVSGCGEKPIGPGPGFPDGFRLVSYRVQGYPATISYTMPDGSYPTTVASSNVTLGPFMFFTNDAVTLCSSGVSVTSTHILTGTNPAINSAGCDSVTITW